MTFTEKGFEFVEKNGGACVTKILTPGAACVIPESLGGMPVTELADRAVANQPVREVYLPKTLRRIGRYGFYNCENLQILHFYAGTTEIGGGVFNASSKIREIYIHMGEHDRSSLRDFVTEITGRVMVHYYLTDRDGNEWEAARLIFPEYYDEAIENTPARNLSFAIHGSGQKYRYSFADRKIQFDRYDKAFEKETNEESIVLAAEIAVNRLMFPYELREDAKKRYEQFLQENLCDVLLANLRNGEVFRWLATNFAEPTPMEERVDPALEAEELDRLIAASSEARLPEISGILLDLKHRIYPPKKKKFSFDL